MKDTRPKAPIHIKKSHEGLFSQKAKSNGMSVQEFAAHVLADPKSTPRTKKEATFAKNAAHWK